MSLVRFKAANHPQQTALIGPRDEIDDRATTMATFAPMNDRFHFTIDVAAAAHNTKCDRYYNLNENGLSKSWGGGKRVV